MKYNGFYFWMFKSPMKKVLAEKYGKAYASQIMKKSKKLYRELVEKVHVLSGRISLCGAWAGRAGAACSSPWW